LVKPVDANSIVLPTDGYKAPTDAGRVLLGQLESAAPGGDRPKPTVALPAGVTPTLGAVGQPGPMAPLPAPGRRNEIKAVPPKSNKGTVPMPGFSR
jgi:pilus assembly protein CpaC